MGKLFDQILLMVCGICGILLSVHVDKLEARVSTLEAAPTPTPTPTPAATAADYKRGVNDALDGIMLLDLECSVGNQPPQTWDQLTATVAKRLHTERK